MNALIKSQLDQIESRIKELGETLRALREDAQHQADEKERMLKDQWGHRKRLAALEHAVEDYDRVAEENAQLQDIHNQLRAQLTAVLNKTKALSSELRS